jgi:hypothetical protein
MARNAALARTIIYNLPMLDVRNLDGARHRRLPVGRRLAAFAVIVASAWVGCSFAQRSPPPAVGPDGFLSLPQKISVQQLEGLRATAVDPSSAEAAFDLDVRNNMLIVKLANAEVARGFLSESDTARESCYGFERDDGRLKEGYSLCQARVDLVVTARPKAKDGYFASLKAGALYFKFTLLDRTHGASESVYSAAMLRPRK